ncbi:MAG: TrmH family RNA methyltransferase [Planctomycetota bacterium]
MSVGGERRVTEDLVLERLVRPADASRREPVLVVLDDVRSAFNVGLVFRVADTMAVRGLWLGGITPHPGGSERADNRIAKTAVGGSLQTVPWRAVEDPTVGVRRLRRAGWRVVVVEQTREAVHPAEARFGERTVLVFGHERAGVRDALLEQADEVVALPLLGITNSMNVAVCAALVLYERTRPRRE